MRPFWALVAAEPLLTLMLLRLVFEIVAKVRLIGLMSWTRGICRLPPVAAGVGMVIIIFIILKLLADFMAQKYYRVAL